MLLPLLPWILSITTCRASSFFKGILGHLECSKMYLILFKHLLAVPWSQTAFGFCRSTKQWSPCVIYNNCSSHTEGEISDVSSMYVATLICPEQAHWVANDDTEPTGNLCSSASTAGGQDIRTGSRWLLLGIWIPAPKPMTEHISLLPNSFSVIEASYLITSCNPQD